MGMRGVLLVVCLVLIAASPDSPPSSGRPGSGATVEKEAHPAPQAQVENAPPEAQLSPPPDSEKVQPPPGFVGVENPAFPVPQPPGPAVPLGRRFDAGDLAPYFNSGTPAAAKAEFDRGRFARARQLLESEGDSLPIRYLRALSALRAEAYSPAAEEMSALARDYPVLRDRCLVHAGIAYEELHQWDAAAERFAAVGSGSKLYGDARLGLARVLRRNGDVQGAISAISPLADLAAPAWGRDPGAEALISLADLLREKKNPAAERQALIRLWSAHPLSPLAAQAEKRLRGVAIPVEIQVARSEQLIEAHRNRKGLASLDPPLPKLKLPDALACRAHFAYGKALRKERQHAKAIRVLTLVVAQCKDADLRARAMYVLGSSRSISDVAHGAETYELLAREFPSHSFADDALFYAADLHLKNGHLDRALERLAQVAERYPDGDFAAEALFKSFWIHRGRGAVDAAMRLLDRIEARFIKAEESYELERARYWRARILEAQGHPDQATEVLSQLLAEHPTTYYGLLARIRLARLAKDKAERVLEQLMLSDEIASPWPLFAGPLGDDPHFLAGLELFRLGFPEAVSTEILAVNRVPLPREGQRLLVQLLYAAGDLRSAHAVARVSLRRDLSGPIRSQNHLLWQVAYPNAFHELVEKHCRVAGVDPYLLQALIREESALDPKALSWAGALGLSQLMLSTARSLARPLNISGVTQESLLEPDQNLQLGSWYLGLLLKRFQGSKAHALAAYNAGADAVNRWDSARGNLELDEWIEEIPFAETRGYVKRVLRSYNTYQLLYARRVPREAVSRSEPW
ncbi:MAG TPA: transglycosylase SLT domain-containing protein [Myxococcaceae bacterium]|nr:transglycosylase SLT domain-containing protein [Myxococcaceae bacterium]